METNLLDKQSVSAKFAVTIPQKEVGQTFDRVLRSVSRQVRIPGFRPGKAPKGVLLKHIGGPEVLAQEVRDYLVESSYPKAVKELDLAPVHAHFDAKEPSEGSDYTFEVEVDLYPDIELPDISEIVIDSAPEPLTDDMLEASIENLRNEYATQVPVERPAEAGDILMLELVPGEDAPEDAEPGRMPVDLSRTTDNLREQLVGKSMDEELELTLEPPTLDEEDEDPDEPVKLKVIIRDIKEKELPGKDDEFAKTLGLESWEEVETRVKESIQAQLDSDAFEAQREEFIEKLVEETDFDLPKSIVSRRKVEMLNNLGQDLKREDLSLEDYIEQNDEYDDKEDFEADLQSSAEAAVKRDLVLEQLLEKRGTTLSNDEFNNALRYMAAQYGQDVAKFRRERGDTWLENYRFLLTRDKAVREAVRELVGEPEAEADEAAKVEAAETAEEDGASEEA